eukprot:CAMPEP_0206023160 /NCGR_PEP_ID=MMETSP1464-20131121/36004_1 /ASSEMBLY_ACC=CAM_ASM_001124 /TAXON_ID=119497 /ORGANISM="Exanthemachrysis gayraliae, Strain RCC1523" /LENGTH=54 /DNA_ID=CAMNT_0053397137 /DNA_START=35 /DNA_END=199 /DNA_ORIENTATION=+
MTSDPTRGSYPVSEFTRGPSVRARVSVPTASVRMGLMLAVTIWRPAARGDLMEH